MSVLFVAASASVFGWEIVALPLFENSGPKAVARKVFLKLCKIGPAKRKAWSLSEITPALN